MSLHLETSRSPRRGPRVRKATLPLFALLVAILPLTLASWLPAPAEALTISHFDVVATEADGSPALEAGAHPYEMTTTVELATEPGSQAEPGGPYSEGDLRDLSIALPPGLIENPTAVPRCSFAAFDSRRFSPYQSSLSGESCPDQTQVGVLAVESPYGGGTMRTFGLFNLDPPPGVPSELGAAPFGTPITFSPHVREAGGEYGLTLSAHDLSQRFDILGLHLTVWGDPWLLSHDGERGDCLNEVDPEMPFGEPGSISPVSGYQPGTCSATKAPASGPPIFQPPHAYLTLPSDCGAPLSFTASADSWQESTDESRSSSVYRDAAGEPLTLRDCPSISTTAVVQPSTDRTDTPTGLDFRFAASQIGFVENVTAQDVVEPEARAGSPVRKAVVRLPEGLTINPALGSGLGVCSEAAFAAETPTSPPGAGCPNASKIGEVSVDTPLSEEALTGSVFLGQPDDPADAIPGAENPFDSLFPVYVVAKAPGRGLMVRFAGKLEPNPQTGQIVAVFEGLPQLPYTELDVHFRSGQRTPLDTGPECGGFVAPIELSLWADPGVVFHDISSFFLAHGNGGGPCPSGDPPFVPTASGGALNSFAGAYTPFYLHLQRTDAEQEITSYAAQLPPGMLAKLSGVARCPDASIEAARSESGTQVEADPPCPMASWVGRTDSGYGVGAALAYAPGNLYFAGPYHGHPISLVAIDSAKVGPFDLGTIVVRFAFSVNPQSARLTLDPQGSDPIPHIIDGIPIHLRDVRVYIDRPEFTVNPTDCAPLSYSSTLTGSAPPFTSPHTASATAAVPFQVSGCSGLRFAPELALRLLGKRGGGRFPSLRAHLTAHPGDANLAAAQVALPATEFLAQSHIKTICTGAQFAAGAGDGGACPAASIYGHATARTPLLGEPLSGPVYLRSSSHTLPDLVVPLSGGGMDIDLDARIDSVHGGIRATFEDLPDAPLTNFTMTMDGGRKGLLETAAGPCRREASVHARLLGQNNKAEILDTPLQVDCGGTHSKRHHRHEHRGAKHHPTGQNKGDHR